MLRVHSVGHGHSWAFAGVSMETFGKSQPPSLGFILAKHLGRCGGARAPFLSEVSVMDNTDQQEQRPPARSIHLEDGRDADPVLALQSSKRRGRC